MPSTKRKLVAQANDPRNSRTAKAYYDPLLEEYIVRLYYGDKLYKPADYFTDDRQDAIDTCHAMLK